MKKFIVSVLIAFLAIIFVSCGSLQKFSKANEKAEKEQIEISDEK